MDPWAAAAQAVSTVFDNSGILVSLENTEKLQEYVFILNQREGWNVAQCSLRQIALGSLSQAGRGGYRLMIQLGEIDR